MATTTSQKQGLSQRLNGIGSGQTGINYDVISRLGRLPNAINGEKREGTGSSMGSSPFAQHDDLIMYDVASRFSCTVLESELQTLNLE